MLRCCRHGQKALGGTTVARGCRQCTQSSTESCAGNVQDWSRLARAAVIGAPNAGKSCLVNALVGQRITAVSRKTNTTRSLMLGAANRGASQVALWDTPGIVSEGGARSKAHRRAVKDSWANASSCDAIVFVIDAFRHAEQRDPRVERALQSVRERVGRMLGPNEAIPGVYLVLNKCDKFKKRDSAELAAVTQRLEGMQQVRRTFHASALHKRGTNELLEHLFHEAVPRPWDLPGSTPESPFRDFLAEEAVREEVFKRLHRELPYAVEVRHVSRRELASGDLRIEQELLVDGERRKGHILGKGGAVIGEISEAARRKLSRTYNTTVHLILRVNSSGIRSRHLLY